MDAERWRKIESLYHSALQLEPGQRPPFLAEACNGDESLRREVDSLLAQADEKDSFLEGRAMDVAAKTLASARASSVTSIGRYRIVRLLGEGGMGAVYEAEQDQPRRSVALKVIRPGLATPEQLWRFQHESHALGRLQHPGIAQIYEASTADTGFGQQPYFAMELIRGSALDHYAQIHQLNSRQRLELLAKVCDAVQHAHQRGLIHRDLKPGNILVDETGQPKILDFGVARVAEGDRRATQQTSLGQLVGTLAYMSPEQVCGDPLEVDIRSDVYSLGVILYELLAGRLPYQVDRRQLLEAVRTIREEDPTPLSLTDRKYRGDIETIVGKVLEKDKTRRYAAAADLSADIHRYLNDEPITARPPSASYQLGKFARRHRALVVGVAAIFAVLLAGVSASTYEAVRASRAGQAAIRERDRATAVEHTATQDRDRALKAEQGANRERNRAVEAEAKAVQARNRALAEKQRADTESATAKAVNDFLRDDVLAQASLNQQARPGTKPDPDLKVRTALDRAAASIPGKFDKQPLVEASIRQTIGIAYLDLQLFPEAEPQLVRSLDLRRRILGDNHPDTLATLNNLAVFYLDQGKSQQAEPLVVKTLEVRTRLFGEESPITLVTMNNLAALYRIEGKYAGAEAVYAKALQVRRRVLGENDRATAATMHNLASLYRLEGKYAQAEPLAIRALEVWRATLGEEAPETLQAMSNVAGVYQGQQNFAGAEPLFLKVLDVRRRTLGAENAATLRSLNDLAALYRAQNRYAEAEPLLTKVVEGERQALGPAHPETTDATAALGEVFLHLKQYGQAETLGREALNNWEKRSPDDWKRFFGQVLVGASLAGQQRYQESELLLVSGQQGLLQRQAGIPLESRRVLSLASERIVQLYESWGKPEKAAEWREKLQLK